MKSIDPRLENIYAAEPVERQLKHSNHDSVFDCSVKEKVLLISEHDVSVLPNPSLKLKNLFSMSTLVDPGNHLRMLHNTIALMVRKKNANRLFLLFQCQC